MTFSKAKDRADTIIILWYNNVHFFRQEFRALHHNRGAGRASAEDKTARCWSTINLLDIFIMDLRCLKDFLSALSVVGRTIPRGRICLKTSGTYKAHVLPRAIFKGWFVGGGLKPLLAYSRGRQKLLIIYIMYFVIIF